MRSVQPRIRLTRSFDQSGHSYLGYCDERSCRILSGVKLRVMGVWGMLRRRELDHNFEQPGFLSRFHLALSQAFYPPLRSVLPVPPVHQATQGNRFKNDLAYSRS